MTVKCDKCGSSNLEDDGSDYNSTTWWEIWKCLDCGAEVIGHVGSEE